MLGMKQEYSFLVIRVTHVHMDIYTYETSITTAMGKVVSDSPLDLFLFLGYTPVRVILCSPEKALILFPPSLAGSIVPAHAFFLGAAKAHMGNHQFVCQGNARKQQCLFKPGTNCLNSDGLDKLFQKRCLGQVV